MPRARQALIDRCPSGGSVVKIHAMKRDMDLVRNLLLEIEDGRRAFELMTPEIAEILGPVRSGRSVRSPGPAMTSSTPSATPPSGARQRPGPNRPAVSASTS